MKAIENLQRNNQEFGSPLLDAMKKSLQGKEKLVFFACNDRKNPSFKETLEMSQSLNDLRKS